MVSPIKFQRVHNQRLWDPVSAVQKLKKQWSQLAPVELANRIVDLEGRVQRLAPNMPGLKKVQRLVGGMQFQFVFPVAIEVKAFCRKIEKQAARIFKTHSVALLRTLNETQRGEIERYRA